MMCYLSGLIACQTRAPFFTKPAHLSKGSLLSYTYQALAVQDDAQSEMPQFTAKVESMVILINTIIDLNILLCGF